MHSDHLDAPGATGLPPWWAAFESLPMDSRPEANVVEALHRFWPDQSDPAAPRTAGGVLLRPVRQTAALSAVQYETEIARTGNLPTRDNAHDWYNALVWLAFPQTKQTLNALQVAQGSPAADAAMMPGNGRTPRRDALTLFDENGALILTCDARVPERLRRHAWKDLFVSGRVDWMRDSRVLIVGHALLEKLEQPRIDLCAHARVLVVPRSFLERPGGPAACAAWRCDVDGYMAADIGQHLMGTSDLQPLPLMGIPGWDARNEDSDFYNNTRVFRPPRGRLS